MRNMRKGATRRAFPPTGSSAAAGRARGPCPPPARIWVVSDHPAGPRAYFSSPENARRFIRLAVAADPDFDWTLKSWPLSLDSGRWIGEGEGDAAHPPGGGAWSHAEQAWARDLRNRASAAHLPKRGSGTE